MVVYSKKKGGILCLKQKKKPVTALNQYIFI